MSFWTAIVIIVAIGTLSEVYRSKLKAEAGRSEEAYAGIAKRMARLEDRMANLETIVLDREKSAMFAELRGETSRPNQSWSEKQAP